jgi:hypothetical protein
MNASEQIKFHQSEIKRLQNGFSWLNGYLIKGHEEKIAALKKNKKRS